MPVIEPVAELLANVSQPFERARAMPPSVYTSPEFLEREIEYIQSAEANDQFAQLKVLLDAVNREERGCTERVYRGVSAGAAEPGHLSHLARPNYDFAQYLAERTGGFARNLAG